MSLSPQELNARNSLGAADVYAAAAWRRKAVVACRASVKVHEFLATPTD